MKHFNNRKITTAYIDYKKAFDSVPHIWLLKILEAYKIHPRIIRCLAKVMGKWCPTISFRTESNTIQTEPIYIRRGIFQGVSLNPIWFCLALNLLSVLLNKTPIGYSIRNGRNTLHNITHLLYMEDIQLYASTIRSM